jgi:hypothetical protein
VSKSATSAEESDKSLVYEIPVAGALVGLKRNASYAAASRGELGEIVQFGRQKKVLKASFHRKFKIPTD